MINEERNTALYQKMFAEQESFRDWLKGQPPEEILNHAYEYTIREDILLSLEYHDLSDAQINALMNSPSPLADVFKDFEKLETDHMDTVWDCLENRADAILEEQRRVLREMPVYTQSGTYAHEHGELEQYRASNEANMACKQAVEDAIRDHYSGYSLDGKAAVAEVVNAFGIERTMYILANTVQQKDHDGRISPSNKEWAKSIPIQKNPDAWGGDRNVYLIVNSHPGLTDLFVSAFRKELCRQQEKTVKPSVLDKLQRQPIKNSPKISANFHGSGNVIEKEIIKAVRFSPEEMRLVQEKMRQLGTSNFSAFMRKMAIDGYVVKLELPELRELVSLLRYSSNNLNQLTRRVHESGRIYDVDLEDIHRGQEQLWDAAQTILDKLSKL